MQRNWREAKKWARSLDVDPAQPPTYPQEAIHVALARVHLAQRRPENLRLAEVLLTAALSVAEPAGRMGRVVEIRMLQALALQAKGNIAAAQEALSRSLALAEPQGYVRTFLAEGQPMLGLLQQLDLDVGRPSDYVRRLVEAFEGQALHPAAGVAPTLVESLSPRELEVLHLLADGRSTAEIAERLVIAVGTAKRHTLNLYGKLGVNSRTQAIAKARGLGLLD
jgi:LuxR family maltose regulon positive regulatory protein